MYFIRKKRRNYIIFSLLFIIQIIQSALGNVPDLTQTNLTIGLETKSLPSSYLNSDGIHIGMISDYISYIEKTTEIKFKKVWSDNWTETIRNFKDKKINSLSGPLNLSLIPGQLISRPFFVDSIGIVMKKNKKIVESFNELKELKISILKGHGYTKKIYDDYPHFNYTNVSSIKRGLESVSSNRADVLLVPVMNANYIINKFGLDDLKVLGKTKYVTNFVFVLKNNAVSELKMINNSLERMTSKEKINIINKWYNIKQIDPKTDYKLIFFLIFLAFLFISTIIFWKNKLLKEVLLRKKLEKELKIQKDKTNLATKMKSRFLSNMNYELRSPLNSIIGFSDILVSKIKDPQYKEYLLAIQSGGQNLLSIINDCLELSKIEAGKEVIHPQNTSLRSLLKEMELMLNEKATSKNIRMIFNTKGIIPSKLLIDSPKLKQILINLIGNAIKFTLVGQIQITTQCIPDKKNNQLITLKIEVKDTGIGIESHFLDSIFERFEKVDEKAHQPMGTGLGLSICKNLIDLMGGEIHVTSVFHQGSTFTILIPNIEKSKEIEAIKNINKNNIEMKPLLKSRILVVDDMPINRKLISGYLADSSVEIIEAKNGEDALEKIAHAKFDLILMDVKMPVMNGVEATQKLRNDKNLKSIPVIAMTASLPSINDEDKEYECFDSCLYKPISKNAVFKELSKYL